jgi:hypothetical protein
MPTAFENVESLTAEQVLIRFKKIMGRNMTPEEKRHFLLPDPEDRSASEKS